jgi:hypothetical protein
VIGKIIIAQVITHPNGNAICLPVMTLLTNSVTINTTVKTNFSELCGFWNSTFISQRFFIFNKNIKAK